MTLFENPPIEKACSARISAAPSWWMWALIGLIALAVYANSIPNQYAYDDCGIVQNNPAVVNLEWNSIWWSNYWPSPEGPADMLYRPLTIYSYLATHALTSAVWPYHAINVLLHAAISVMVGVLSWRILRDRWMAVLAGLLFAVHPLHTEVVANIVGRAELLATFWSLVALLFFFPDQDPIAGRPPRRGILHGVLVAACFLLAMLSKETPAALLGALLFLDVWRWFQWPAGRPTLWAWMRSQVLRYHIPVWSAFGIYMAMRISSIGLMIDTNVIHPLVNPLVDANRLERIVTPFMLLAKYVSLMVWPGVLSADYSAPSLMPTSNIFQGLPLLGLLMVVTGIASVISYWKTSPRLVAVLALFASSYVLVGNFIRIGTIFGERLFYWPSVFFLMIVAYIVVRLYQRLAARAMNGVRLLWTRRLAVAAVIIATIAASVRTVVRNPDWYDNISLALATAQGNPNSAKACDWAGSVLVCQTSEKWTKDFGESLLLRTIDIYPTMGSAYWNLTKYYFREGRTSDALIELAKAARYQSGSTDIRRALRALDASLKDCPTSSYMPALEKWLAKEPDNAMAHFAYGLVMRSQGKLDLAEAQFCKALDCDPYYGEAAAELGLIKGMRGDFPASVNLLRSYVIRMRYNGIARCDLAGALLQLDPVKFPDSMREAQMNIDRAEILMPSDPQVHELMNRLQRKRTSLIKNAGKSLNGHATVADHA